MAASKGYSGEKYANGNYKDQQKAYNKTKKACKLECRKQTKS